MKTIHKFRLQGYHGTQWIDLPLNAKPISAQMQHGALCVWAEVDEVNRLVPHEFFVAGTGQLGPAYGRWRFISTVQDGPFVWHVYISEPE